ncbi:MAG: hypothetical protein RIB80_12100 [Rhodospirillales bacterium]
MHTFGSVVLALIAVLLMQALLVFVGGVLGQAIISTTGVVWIPFILMVGLSGCATYAGVYFSLKVASSGNAKITFYFIAFILVLSGGAGLIKEIGNNEIALAASLLCNTVSGIFGAWLGMQHVSDERLKAPPSPDS